MNEQKTWEHNGRLIRCKQNFTARDFDKYNRIESFYDEKRVQITEENNNYQMNMLKNMTGDEFVDMLFCMTEPVEGEPLSKEFFEDIPMDLGLEIFLDFFFVFIESQKNIAKVSTNFETKANAYKKQLKSRKTN